MNGFTHEQLSTHVYRIVDILGICCYLVVGKEKACLLDTCNGLGNIKEYVETITDLPVFVILTHGHLDHMGGAALFDDIYMNHEEINVFKKHGDMNFRIQETINHAKLQVDKKDFVHTYQGAFRGISNEDIFELGDVTIKMLLVKGHTPGMMCPLIVEDRIIVFGDACGVGVLLHDEYSSCVSEYKESLVNLKKYENDYDFIYRNHGTFESPKGLLHNVIECCDLILSGKDDHVPITIHGVELFACHECDAKGHARKDGKEGNIMYSLDKVK